VQKVDRQLRIISAVHGLSFACRVDRSSWRQTSAGSEANSASFYRCSGRGCNPAWLCGLGRPQAREVQPPRDRGRRDARRQHMIPQGVLQAGEASARPAPARRSLLKINPERFAESTRPARLPAPG
jgi:hypothetical protein